MLKRKDDKMHLIILGAGGYGRTVADVAGQTEEYSTILFLDDNSVAPDVAGKCAEFARFRGEQTAFYPAFGNKNLGPRLEQKKHQFLYYKRRLGINRVH